MKLNEEQKLLVNEYTKNILLLASAGTGKTDTLSKRVAGIIKEGKAKSDQILCITFTNKACKEMQERVEAIVRKESKNITIKTFHSFCFDIIKSNFKKNTDVFSDFIIFDEEDCKELIRSCNYFNYPINNLHLFIKEIKSFMIKGNLPTSQDIDYKSIIKNFYMNYDEKVTKVCSERGKLNLELKKYLKDKGDILIQTYNSLLYSNHGLDFDDLIYITKELFKDENVVRSISEKYKYINIDEMQDIGTIEYFIIEKIFKNNNILMCGDIFQTIYSWRGSEPDIIINTFKEKYKPLEIVFSKNYRATNILTESSLEYLKNAFETQVTTIYKDGIKSATSIVGEKIKLSINDNARSEARFIFDSIKSLEQNGENIYSTCILTRDNNYNMALSNYLKSLQYEGVNFEFILVDQFKFFRRQEIKDIIAFLKLIVNQYDSLSLKRIITRLPSGIGDKTIEEIEGSKYKCVGIRISDFIDPSVVAYGEKYALLVKELEKDNIIVFDVESTGTDVTEDEIIQIAAIKINSKGIVIGKFEKFIKNDKSVGTSQYVHGFSDAFLRENGEDKRTVLLEFCEFIKNSIIVGHNVQFDINILTSELKRLKMNSIDIKGFYDTLDIYRRFYPEATNHKLETLSKIFNTKNKPSHDAMDDILATGELLINAIYNYIIPTTMERMSYMIKHLKSFSKISEKLNSLFDKAKDMRPYDIVVEVINSFHIKSLYTGEDGKEKIERLRDFYVLLKDLDNKDKSNRDSLLDIIKITGLSNGELESLIINRAKRPRIPIITIHQAKGLEYENVFLAGAQKNTFPSFRALNSNNLEEEKRLFYVAITRAKKRLFISCNTSGYFGYNDKSPFINHIPSKYITSVKE